MRPGTRWVPAALTALCLALGCSARASSRGDGLAAFRAGRYDEAIDLLTRQVKSRPASAEAHRLLARAFVEVGRYAEAEKTLRAFALAHSGSPEVKQVQNTLGEVLRATGRRAEAEDAFRKAVAGQAADRLTAELNLAILRHERGDENEAQHGFDTLIDAYNAGGRLSSTDLTAVGVACRFLGARNPQLFKDALKALDQAVRVDPRDFEPRIRLGELFLEKYDAGQALKEFEAVLKENANHPRALLGKARALDFEGTFGALDLVKKSLEVNPWLVEARIVLAEMRLAFEEYEPAAREAEVALQTDASSLPALSTLAAARYLGGDRTGFEDARRRVLELNPRYADLYNTLADVCVRNRLYREAVEFARHAVDLDPASWRGFGLLGLNQLRLGRMAEGRKDLDVAFAGDPYNVWFKNTLDLLDTLPRYREVRSPHFVFVVDAKEADLLSPYLTQLGEEALAHLSERYGYRPQTPIRVEVYPRHADFSVRTVGLAGLGALGACFGNVLAIDSPSARETGQFNWGSTLWHELAHTITLGLTDHRVPRWLSEGISVYEERRARPGWGDDVSLEFLESFKSGRLRPLAELNSGFVRPRHPAEIGLSYFQASLVVELIERDHGREGLPKLLAAYRAKSDTVRAFQDVLGTTLSSFDETFTAFVQERWRGPLAALRAAPKAEAPSPLMAWLAQKKESVLGGEAAGEKARKDPGDFLAQLQAGRALMKEKRLDDALVYLQRARDLFPDYAGKESPYGSLARIHKEKGGLREAATALEQLTSLDETSYDAHLELASLYETLGDAGRASGTLERAVFISPFDPTLHEHRATLLAGLGRWPEAVQARESVLAREPVDRAEALYRLADARFQSGDAKGARRDVLRALEIAPAFAKAQDLLLKLHDAPHPGGGER